MLHEKEQDHPLARYTSTANTDTSTTVSTTTGTVTSTTNTETSTQPPREQTTDTSTIYISITWQICTQARTHGMDVDQQIEGVGALDIALMERRAGKEREGTSFFRKSFGTVCSARSIQWEATNTNMIGLAYQVKLITRRCQSAKSRSFDLP